MPDVNTARHCDPTLHQLLISVLQEAPDCGIAEIELYGAPMRRRKGVPRSLRTFFQAAPRPVMKFSHDFSRRSNGA